MAAIGANPFVISSWNLYHHARFYDEYPRTWSPVQFVIKLRRAGNRVSPRWSGARSACLGAGVPLSVWSTLLLLILTNLTGRNMGEVARLWLLYMPPLLVGAGYSFERWIRNPAPLGASTAILGAQTLALQSFIQVSTR